MIIISSEQIAMLIIGNVMINIVTFALGYIKGVEDAEMDK